MTPCGDLDRVHIGLGNGLLPGGTKPLPEPVLTCHQRDSVAFTWVQFHMKCSRYQLVKRSLKDTLCNISSTSLRGKWLNKVSIHHSFPWPLCPCLSRAWSNLWHPRILVADVKPGKLYSHLTLYRLVLNRVRFPWIYMFIWKMNILFYWWKSHHHSNRLITLSDNFLSEGYHDIFNKFVFFLMKSLLLRIDLMLLIGALF